jgi:hypothetical protein
LGKASRLLAPKLRGSAILYARRWVALIHCTNRLIANRAPAAQTDQQALPSANTRCVLAAEELGVTPAKPFAFTTRLERKVELGAMLCATGCCAAPRHNLPQTTPFIGRKGG